MMQIQVDLISRYTSKFEKWCALIIFGISFVFCLSLFSFLPDHILLFNLRDLSTDLSQRISSFLSIQSPGNIIVHFLFQCVNFRDSKRNRDKWFNDVFGCSFGGKYPCFHALSTCYTNNKVTLLSIFILYGMIRSLQVLLNPPRHLETYFTLAKPLVLLKHFQDAILLVNCTLFVNPLVEQFHLDISSLRRAQALGLLLWSLCQLCLFRSIIQVSLDV